MSSLCNSVCVCACNSPVFQVTAFVKGSLLCKFEAEFVLKHLTDKSICALNSMHGNTKHFLFAVLIISLSPTVSSRLELSFSLNNNDTASAPMIHWIRCFHWAQRWIYKHINLQFYIHQPWQRAQGLSSGVESFLLGQTTSACVIFRARLQRHFPFSQVTQLKTTLYLIKIKLLLPSSIYSKWIPSCQF